MAKDSDDTKQLLDKIESVLTNVNFHSVVDTYSKSSESKLRIQQEGTAKVAELNYKLQLWNSFVGGLLVVIIVVLIAILSMYKLISSEATVGLVGGLLGYIFGRNNARQEK